MLAKVMIGRLAATMVEVTPIITLVVHTTSGRCECCLVVVMFPLLRSMRVGWMRPLVIFSETSSSLGGPLMKRWPRRVILVLLIV